jgi:hypothetical protein
LIRGIVSLVWSESSTCKACNKRGALPTAVSRAAVSLA